MTTLSTLMNKPELHYYELASNVVAFSSTRYGGVSKGNYAAFNINKYCGDVPEDIEQNRRNLANSLGIDIDKLIVHKSLPTNILICLQTFVNKL